MKLNQVTVPVRDVPRAIAFYRLLGFQLIVHSNDAYARFICPDGETTFSLHLVTSLPTGEGIWLYFECDALDAQVAALQEKGVVFETAPEDQRWLWREARLKDPDGNQLILYHAGENRKNPPWRLAEV